MLFNKIFLQKIYAQLDEPDGVSGILATQDQSPTLQQLVLAHEINGQLQVLLENLIGWKQCILL